MNKKNIIVLIFLLLLPSALFPEKLDLKKEFDLANKFYKDNEIEKSLQKYLILLNNGYNNFEINYNLGCCYYKLNQLGKSRFYFEKALYYKPFNKDLYHNLNIIYNSVLKNPSSGEQIIMNRRIIYFIPINILIVLLLIFTFSTIAFIVLSYFLSKNRKIALIFLSLNFILSLIFTTLFFTQYNEYNKKIFITIEDDTIVYLSPDEYETMLQELDEGISGIILNEIDDYIRVRLEDGLNGWIKKENVIYNKK